MMYQALSRPPASLAASTRPLALSSMVLALFNASDICEEVIMSDNPSEHMSQVMPFPIGKTLVSTKSLELSR